MESSTYSQRLAAIRQKTALSARQFAISIGVDPSQYVKTEKGTMKLTNDANEELISKHNVNLNWLLKEKGNMFFEETSSNESNKVEEDVTNYVIHSKSDFQPEPGATKPVPVYDVEFAAGQGNQSFVDQTAASHPVMWLTLPEVIGCDLIIKARGESMTDLIHPRDWIGLKQILDFQNLLAYNQAYAIVAGEFELLKYIKKSSKKGYITLSSENAFYEDFDIPLKSVDQLFLIKVVIPFSKVRSLA